MLRTLLSNVRAQAQAQRSPLTRSLKTPRRFQSTTNSTQEKAQEKAKETFAAAQKGFARATEVAKKATGGLGERVGSLMGSYREPVSYNLSVGREILKQVYLAERLRPPTSWSTISTAYQTLWSRASNPAYWREILRTGEYKRVGVYALEAYGIFKIGEIIGRRHIVGYKLE